MRTDTESPRELGIAALETGDLDRALELLGAAVLRDTLDAEARARLGVAQGRKGLHEQARRSLQGALVLQPENAEYHCLLGAQWEREGDTAAAVAAYREALRCRPDHPTAAARLELIGVDPGTPAPTPEPAPAPSPTPPVAPVAAAPTPAGVRLGTIECRKCGEWSQQGILCEWCGASLATGTAPPHTVPHALTEAHLAGAQALGLPVAGIPLVHRRTNRGGTSLTLGLLSMFFSLAGFGCGFPALLGILLGGLAAGIGGRDLAGIREGAVQEYGSGALQAGRVLGILGMLAGLGALGVWAVLVLSYVAIGF